MHGKARIAASNSAKNHDWGPTEAETVTAWKGLSKQAERSASLKPYSAYQPTWQREEDQGAKEQSISAMQPAEEEPESIDKEALKVDFLEAMNANLEQLSRPTQAEIDEAIRREKDLEKV